MKTSRIALNGRFSGTPEPTGTQVAAFHLFDALIRAPRDCRFVVFADPACEGVRDWAAVPGTELVHVPFRRWRRTRSQLWEQFSLPREIRRHRCDLVHHPITSCPRWGLGIPSLVTLHDLNFLHHPEWYAPAFRRWMKSTALPGLRQAAQVVAISDYVLADARVTLKLAPGKTSRIYNGLRPLPATGTAGERHPFRILGVNLWQPHKNLGRLLDAFTRLKAEMPALELHLAGRPQAQFREQPELAARLRTPGITVLGYLSEAELTCAYRTAAVLCFPSLEEGFGLPILEAMAAETPVVTSNASCLPEIAGGAAVLVDPYSVEQITAGLRQILLETAPERARRIELGREIAARFRWERSAREYLEIYARLLA